jgi:hypothetical protein
MTEKMVEFKYYREWGSEPLKMEFSKKKEVWGTDSLLREDYFLDAQTHLRKRNVYIFSYTGPRCARVTSAGHNLSTPYRYKKPATCRFFVNIRIKITRTRRERPGTGRAKTSHRPKSSD